jgi:hypothetical protein
MRFGQPDEAGGGSNAAGVRTVSLLDDSDDPWSLAIHY